MSKQKRFNRLVSFGVVSICLVSGSVWSDDGAQGKAVSYTHLTLPTIYSV